MQAKEASVQIAQNCSNFCLHQCSSYYPVKILAISLNNTSTITSISTTMPAR